MKEVKLKVTASPEGTTCVLKQGRESVTVHFPASGGVDVDVNEAEKITGDTVPE